MGIFILKVEYSVFILRQPKQFKIKCHLFLTSVFSIHVTGIKVTLVLLIIVLALTALLSLVLFLGLKAVSSIFVLVKLNV